MSEAPPSQPANQPHSPLLGKTILVTRTEEQAAEFVKLLEQLGRIGDIIPDHSDCAPPVMGGVR